VHDRYFDEIGGHRLGSVEGKPVVRPTAAGTLRSLVQSHCGCVMGLWGSFMVKGKRPPHLSFLWSLLPHCRFIMYLILQKEADKFGFDVSIQPLMVVQQREDVIRYFIDRTLSLQFKGFHDESASCLSHPPYPQHPSLCAVLADYDVPIDTNVPGAYLTIDDIDDGVLVAAADDALRAAVVDSYLVRKRKAMTKGAGGTVLFLRFSHDATGTGAVKALSAEWKILSFDLRRDCGALLRRMVEKRVYNECRRVPDINISLELIQLNHA
jgi:hypothetical protein